jgi:hypothetical protein
MQRDHNTRAIGFRRYPALRNPMCETIRSTQLQKPPYLRCFLARDKPSSGSGREHAHVHRWPLATSQYVNAIRRQTSTFHSRKCFAILAWYYPPIYVKTQVAVPCSSSPHLPANAITAPTGRWFAASTTPASHSHHHTISGSVRDSCARSAPSEPRRNWPVIAS